MKKFGLLSLMLVCIFLVGCSDDTYLAPGTIELKEQQTQKVQQSSNQETKKQQDEFAMKEKCAKYKDNFIQSVKDEYGIGEYYEEHGFNLSDETFVFYSPTRNSCVGAYSVYIIRNDQHRTRTIYYKIQDLLTNEVIHDTYQVWDKGGAVQDQSYRNAYLDMVYDLQGYPECYCKKMDICRGYGGDGCENTDI